MGAEQANHETIQIDHAQAEQRLLTEANNLIAGMRPNGSIDSQVLQDEFINLMTAVAESGMPLAVTKTFHPVEYREDEAGRQHRKFMWMGKCLVENTANSRSFYKSPLSEPRSDIEDASAQDIQEKLRPGIAKPFFSPKAPLHDMPADVAKLENLYADDSIRVSKLLTNSSGQVVAHYLESLLVRDVPLAAWVAMLRDPNNIFGRAFDIADDQSAVSVMALFEQLELPEVAVPEGPVTLVAAVQKYIKDNQAYDSVGRQIDGFRHDQELYKEQAEIAARNWLDFEVELARSLVQKSATLPIKAFIAKLQDNWNNEHLEVINRHSLGNMQYEMTRELAAVLERAKRNLVRGNAAIAVGNNEVMAQIPEHEAQQLHYDIRGLQLAYANNLISEQEYLRQQSDIDRRIAAQNITGGGGCPGDTSANFRNPGDADGTGSDKAEGKSDWEKGKRDWKKGVCQVKTCPSPKPTEVGPCSVCKKCQDVFDSGGDPTKISLFRKPKPAASKGSVKQAIKHIPELAANQPPGALPVAAQVEDAFANIDVAAIEA